MPTKNHHILLSSLILLCLVFSLVQPASAMIQQAASEQTTVTVDPTVLTEMETQGSASYWIDFKTETDLSAAYKMDWSERGWYVYNTLLKASQESQARVTKYLTNANVEYESYWIKNTILVKSSNRLTLNGLLNFSEIKAISPRHTYILYQPDTTDAVVDGGNAINAIEPSLAHINADDVWGMGIDGTGLVVANIDTGVRFSHQALVGQYRGNNGDGTFDHNYNWFNPDNPSDNAPRDGNGHGTHTMGTMVGDDGGANQIGIAPGAEWMACAGCPDGSCTDSALLGCGQWMAAPTDVTGANANPNMRPNVVNNSWGDCGTTYDNWYEGPIAAWHAAGIYPIFSNGNASNCGYSSPPGLNTVGNPARSGNVTGVGSSGEQNGQYANHSNWGPTDNLDTINPVAGFETLKPQVIAPGVSIRSSTPGSDTEYEDGWSGTSMSAPHVTGLVALIWQAAPCLVGDYALTETIIEETATDITYDDGSATTPTNFPNYATGWGEIDALAAVNQAMGMCAMGTLNGTVTTDGTNPVVGVNVRADDGAGFARNVLTDASGAYTVDLPEGDYTLTASKYGYETDTDTVTIVEDETSTVNFTTPQLATSIVSGNVTDGGVAGLGSHGYPLYASIQITAPGFSQTIYTDPFTGHYEIQLVDSVPHTFVVSAVPSGYNTLTETVTPTGAAYTHNISLMINGAVCAAPGYKPDYDFFYSFENSAEGFVAGGTTSFAWGDFTSGPGEGHSGTKGIATNPAGSYSASELGWMASPVIDLTSFGTDAPVIQWYDWKDIESASYDWARLDVTKDGGVTWTPVWGPVGGVTDTAYHQQSVILDSTYNVANFQFRFYFKSDGSLQYEGWYVDDIGITSVPSPAPTTVFTNDFEAGNGGFTVSGTSSFAWGVPTSGPSSAHSGTNVWATNLAGDYNSSEDGWITSPVIDLSSYAGLAPTISFWQWNDIEGTNFDWGAVEATKDGGATWADVSGKIGDVSSWSPKSIQLDATYAVSNFQFRFYFKSDSSLNYAGWYIDDVAVTVAEPVVVAAPCVVIPGGVVAGTVKDALTSEVLVGAGVASPTVETTTFDLAGDLNNAGLYWVFQPTAANPENVVFTASYARYADDVETVAVAANAVTRQDFSLGSGQLSFNPTALDHTMMLGASPATATLTISNSGLADATYELVEKETGYTPTALSIPAFTSALPEDTRPVSMGRAPEAAAATALSSSGLFNGLLAGEPAFAVDLQGENFVSIPNTTTPGTWSVVGSVAGSDYYSGDFVGGDFSTLYVINNTGSTLQALNTATGAATLIGTATPPVSGQTFSGLTGTPTGEMYGVTTDCSSSNLVMVDVVNGATTNLGALTGVECGIDLAYNTDDNMIYVVDIVTDSLYKVDPATMTTTLVGALGVNAGYAQGMDYEETTGILYWAAYTTSGELRVIDMATGASSLVGAFPSGVEVDSLAFATGGISDVPWLSEAPVSGTVTAAGSTDITVTFDPTSLGQPGTYTAELKAKHNTPFTYANIPVTLHLQAPATFGTLNGTVNGMAACDVNPAPLKNVTVNIYDQASALVGSTNTLANGSYSWSLVAGTYDIEVVAPTGYVGQRLEDVVLAETVTINSIFNLRLNVPCISVTPASIEETVLAGTSKIVQLSVENNGAAAGNFEISEFEAAQTTAAVDLILDDGSRDDGLGIGGSAQFIFLNRFTPPADSFPFELSQIQVFFDSEDLVLVGDEMKLVVYENTSGNADPAVGSSLLATFPVTVQSVGAWNNYTLPTPVTLEGPGDVLIGVIALEIPGASYFPAAMDETASQERSWAGWWTTDVAPETPTLPPDDSWTLIDDVDFPGNWMIRGVGATIDADILWLSETPITGTVPADDSLSVDVTLNSTGLAVGDYKARLRFTGVAAGSVYVPVTMHVNDVTYIYLPVLMR